MSDKVILVDPPNEALSGTQSWDVRPDFHVIAWIFSQLLKQEGQIARKQR